MPSQRGQDFSQLEGTDAATSAAIIVSYFITCNFLLFCEFVSNSGLRQLVLIGSANLNSLSTKITSKIPKPAWLKLMPPI